MRKNSLKRKMEKNSKLSKATMKRKKRRLWSSKKTMNLKIHLTLKIKNSKKTMNLKRMTKRTSKHAGKQLPRSRIISRKEHSSLLTGNSNLPLNSGKWSWNWTQRTRPSSRP